MRFEDVKNVTNMYLYGQLTTPSNKLDDALIRPQSLANNPVVNIDTVDFMANGGGRFAVGGQFELVQNFFNDNYVTQERLAA